MDTTELNAIINVPGFLGTYPYDALPTKPEGDYSIVVNTSPSKDPGSHWLALVLQKGNLYFLDSYGRSVRDQTFSQQFKDAIIEYMGGNKIIHNRKWLQSLSSNVCGEYCIYFIQETHRVGYRKMLHVFTDNFKFNDLIVLNYVENM